MSTRTIFHRNGKRTYEIDGEVVSAAKFRRHKTQFNCPTAGLHPVYTGGKSTTSISMGCHSSEVKMMNQRIHDEGITGVHYEEQRNKRGEVIGGKCVVTDNSKTTGRRRWMKVYGEMCGLGHLRDNDGFD
jgi:hypothetical protein